MIGDLPDIVITDDLDAFEATEAGGDLIVGLVIACIASAPFWLFVAWAAE